MTISLTRPVPPPPEWPRRVRLLRRTAAVVSLLAVLTDFAVMVIYRDEAGGYLALAVSAAGVLLGTRYPPWGLVVAVGGCLVAVALGADPTAMWTIAVLTLFSATLAGVPPFRSAILVAGTLYLLVGVSDLQGFQSTAGIAAASTAAAAAGIGGGLRAQGRYLAVLQQRATETAARAVVAERLRIARDLHDLVGHEVAALNMHIGAAEVSLPAGADRAAAALGEARGAVQAVLRETQQILQVLRRADSEADLDSGQPAPGIEQVAELIDSFRGLGLDVDADLGQLDARQMGSPVGLTLYRVVQEALTNAHRYGDGAARVDLTRTGDVMTLTVTNRRGTNSPPASRRTGYGLIGMQERVTAVGGELQVTGDDLTFRLRATLPATTATGPDARRST